MRPPAIARLICAVGLLAASGPVHASDCFEAGNAAQEAGQPMAAVQRFEAALEDPGCLSVRAGLHMSIGHALLGTAGRDGNARIACRAAEAFAAAEALGTLPQMKKLARDQRAEATGLCRAEQPPPSNVGGWLLAGGAIASAIGGGALLIGSIEQRSTRDDASQDAKAAMERANYYAARGIAVAAHERHVDFGIAGYALLAVGAGLAVGSYLAWDPGDGSNATVIVHPRGFGLAGQF